MSNSDSISNLHIFQRDGNWIGYTPKCGLLVRLTKTEATVLRLYIRGLDILSISKAVSKSEEFCISIIKDLEKRIDSRKTIGSSGEIPNVEELMLIVSQSCNMKCTYCFAGGGNYGHASELMSSKVARDAVDFAVRLGVRKITFFGGEPLLNFKVIREIVNYTEEQKMGVQYGIETNGTLITPEIAEFFKAHNIKTLVSMDGPREVNDACRKFVGGQGTYKSILKGIMNLKGNGVKFAIESVYSCKCSLGVGEIIESLMGYTDTFTTAYAMNEKSVDSGKKRTLIRNFYKGLAEKVIDSTIAGKTIKEINVLNVFNSVIFPVKKVNSFICENMARRIAIFPNGDIYPCETSAKRDLCLGNIYRTDSIVFQKKRKEVLLHFSLDKFPSYPFLNQMGSCILNVRKKRGGGLDIKYAPAINKGFEDILYKLSRLSHKDVEIIAREWHPWMFTQKEKNDAERNHA